MVEHRPFPGFNLVGFRVVFVIRRSEEPVLRIADARVDAYVLHQLEVRQAYAEVVGHTVREPVKETRVLEVELTCLEVDLVLERGVVTERNLFVESLLSYPVLAFERVQGADGESYVRKLEGI